jgi:hypothetical protein
VSFFKSSFQELRLKLHPIKTRIFPVKNGCEFLGFYIYPNFRKVKRSNVRLFEDRLRAMQAAFQKEMITIKDIHRSVEGWIAHVEHANSFGLREKIFSKYVFGNPT